VKTREMSWKELEVALHAPDPPAVLLPLGATEAHGPHLPLDTDTIIAERLAEVTAEDMARRHAFKAVVAQPLPLSVASWAADFAGTVSLDGETAKGLLRSAIASLRRSGAKRIALVNLHFDPGHMDAVRAVVKEDGVGGLAFPDFTRRATASKIGGEFASGSCHGGQFETSLVLAARPNAVRPLYTGLRRIDFDLASAIRAGKRSFREVGLVDAYCGDPASGTAQEGKRLYVVLANLVVEEAFRVWGIPRQS
jgi:creatinine amidohydrolase